MTTTDLMGRPLRDLRISVTDRCNFRCRYCMPAEVFGPGFQFLARSEILSFEEIAMVAEVAVSLGVAKLRLTGGEPLLRRNLPDLVRRLAIIPGLQDLAMTTNGALLAAHAERLAAAGLRRVTVSLDTMNQEVFQRMNGVGTSIGSVLDGIAAAARVGLGPVKLNAVVQRGVNDAGVVDLAEFAREGGHTLRLIEYMDVGESHGWRLEKVVPARELLATIDARWPLEAVAPLYPGEVASRYRYLDGAGEVGMISSVSRPFCGNCTRLRLSADGSLYTCLFSSAGQDVRPLLRSGATPEAISERLTSLWRGRSDRYSEERSSQSDLNSAPPKREMSYLGG